MQRSRVSAINLLYLYLSTDKKTLQASPFAAASPPLPKRPFLGMSDSLSLKYCLYTVAFMVGLGGIENTTQATIFKKKKKKKIVTTMRGNDS